MKNLIFCLALLSAAVFTACQENPLMDNPQNVEQQNYSTDKIPSTNKSIKLDVILVDPRQGIGHNIVYTLIGNVEYALRYYPNNPSQFNDFENASLKLKIDVKLLNQAEQDKLPNFYIRAESFDRLNIPSGGSRTVLLVKKYSITGFPKVYLSCVYEVSTISVSIKDMKLCNTEVTQHAITNQY